jgi:preprotein translocase subunit SecE
VRLGTAGAAGLVALVLAYYLYTLLAAHLPAAEDFRYRPFVLYGAPAVLFAALALVVARYLNDARAADFLIATESEMKKVSWSSKAELIGSTMVVIVTVVLLALFIYAADTTVIVTLERVLGLW